MGLRESLSSRHEIFGPETLKRPEKLVRAIETAREKLLGVEPRQPDDHSLEETYRVLVEAQKTDRFDELHGRHLRRAPWVIFETQERGEKPLVAWRGFLDRYLKQLDARAASSPILALAHGFLRCYPRGQRCFQQLQSTLPRLLAHAGTVRGRRFREQAQEFRLLERDGPAAFARRLMTAGESMESLMDQAGLTGHLALRGFIEHAYVELLQFLRDGLNERRLLETELARVLEFSATGRVLRFPSLRVQLVESLLLPYMDGAADHLLKPRIRDFVLNHYKDPRLHRGHWQAVSEAAQGVMFRWLVENTLEDFFRLLTYSAERRDPDADRQWPYRRAFWSAYLHGGYILDAWVVLAEQVAKDARRHLSQLAGNYGRLERGTGVRSSHAVLVIRIGDLVITEWSHMGKYRVWKDTNGGAPKFYRTSYRRSELINKPDFEKPHASSETGAWQATLSDYIASQTGIVLTAKQYMPAP